MKSTGITMQIINSKKFNRINIKFSDKPSEEIRNELKNAGWIYSSKNNVWYPVNSTDNNSIEFAKELETKYFSDQKMQEDVIINSNDKKELLELIENDSDLNEIITKMNDLYGLDKIKAIFESTLKEIEAESENPKNNKITEQSENKQNSISEEEDLPYVTPFEVIERNEMLYAGSDRPSGYTYQIRTDDGLKEEIAPGLRNLKENEHLFIEYRKWENGEENDYDFSAYIMQKNDDGTYSRPSDLNTKFNQNRIDHLKESEAVNAFKAEVRGFVAGYEEIYSNDKKTVEVKLNKIIEEAFLKVPDNDKETTREDRQRRYDKWYRPMVDEIMDQIKAGNQDIIKAVEEFDLNKEKHVEGNKWYSAEEGFDRDVQYKLLPELYEKVQDKIKAEYDEKKIPYVVMFSSESPVFPSENKVYTVKEFNEQILQADKEFHNRKEYAEKKYGSADNYWDLERDDKLPEEDKGIQFGYDKTNFKLFNIPNPNNPEDTFSYEPSRYDIGDGNGSIFDYVRSTCSYDEFIDAFNKLETQLYFPGVTDSQREFVEKTVKEQSEVLKEELKEKMDNLDKAQNEYKELHKKWLIESTEAENVDEMLDKALSSIKATYDSSLAAIYAKVLDESPFASGDESGSEFLKYTANEAKKMVVSELYLPSRNAQKAMNEGRNLYTQEDWEKFRKIWERFPANVNMTEYLESILQDKCNEKGMAVSENKNSVTHPEQKTENKSVTSKSAELTQEDIEICKKLIPPSQFNFTMELTQGEEGEFYKNKLKEIAVTYRKINVDEELVNKDGTHNVGFRYFLGSTEIFISEIDSDGIGFGYNILNGDLQMSEWGSTSLDEITSIPFIEMDYHVPAGATIEEMLYKEHPESFPEYAPKKVEVERENVKQTLAEIARKKYESEQGSNYDSNLSTTDIAKKLREYVKKNYPDYKFSITSKYFSGGSEINVTLKQAPGEITNEKIMKEYLEHNSAREWWNKDTGKYEKYYEMTDERKKDVIKDAVEHAYTFNIPGAEENPSWMAPEVNKVMMDVQRQLESYNFDHSDSQSDYYHVNFWSHYDISKEAVERSLKITRAPEKSLNFVLDKLAAAGIEVVSNRKEYQWMKEQIDEINITLEMLEEEPNYLQKISPDKKSELDVGQDTTSAISTPNNQNHITFLDGNQELYFNRLDNLNDSNVSPEEFYHSLRKVFDVDDSSKRSGYVCQKLLENHYKLRISNHSVSIRNRTGAKTLQTSIVIKLADDKRRTNEKARVIEYVYNPDTLNTEKMNGIVSGIKDWIKSGNYTDENFDERFISHAELENGKLEIRPVIPVQKMTTSEYYNKEVDAFVTDKSGFVDPEKIAAIDLYGFEKAKEMWKDGEPDWNTRMMLQDKSISDYLNWKHPNNQNYKVDNITYGFAYENKIYLNPDIMTSEVAVHEYTHLWDAYTQRTNPELWQKGKDIFKNTQFWKDVKADPNYADIANNEDLLLSEVHSQVCGKMAEEILNRIAEKDGELTKDTVIDWDKEVWEYVANSIDVANFNKETFVYEDVKEFIVKPIKDLMNGVEITKVINLNTEKELQTKTKQLNKDEFSSIKFSDAFISKNNGILPVIKSGNGYLVGCKKSDIDDFQSPNKFTVNDDILLLIPLEKSALSSIYSKYVINKAKEDFIKSMNAPDFVPESRKLGISDDQKRLYKMVEDNVFKGIELTGNETEVFNAYVKDIIQVNRNAKNQQQLNNYSIITKQIDTDEIDFER